MAGMALEGGQRRDAVANRQAVIDAAAELLPENPDASMQEIADFTGLGRSTVYRHFANREALFGAMTIEAVGHGRRPGRGHPRGERWHRRRDAAGDGRVPRRLRAPLPVPLLAPRGGEAGTRRVRPQPGDAARRVTCDAAAERGEIRSDLPATWIVAQFVALTISLVGDVIGRPGRPRRRRERPRRDASSR